MSTQCTAKDLANATSLAVLNGGSSQGSFSVSATAAGPQIIPLVYPLLIYTQLCIGRTPKAADGATPKTDYSLFQQVVDPNAYGRLRTYFTSGAVITNQQSTTTSSTANIYVDLGLDYSWARAGKFAYPDSDSNGDCKNPNRATPCAGRYHRGPGLDSFLAARLSPIPVAAPVTNTTTMTTTGATTPTTTAQPTSLNVLTSQQSAHIVFGTYLPFVTTRYYNKSYVFTLAPTVRLGFDTLLNPTTSSGTTSTGSTAANTTSTLQTTNFSSVYSFYNTGLRIGWEQLSRSTDQAPQTWSELSLLLGKYTNLPSYVCTSKVVGPDLDANDYSTTSPTGVTTNTAPFSLPLSACGKGNYADKKYASRTSFPRMAIIGKVQFPNYPFVLGIDANLAQYTVGAHRNSIDNLNKAGNDVRIYLGVTFNLLSALAKLNVGGF